MGVDVIAVMGTVMALLFAGNVYFVKRLIDKVELASTAHHDTGRQLSKLSTDVNAIGAQVREIKSDVKDLRHIEIEVAVLRSQIQDKSRDNGKEGKG